MGKQLCTRQWTWLACTRDYFNTRGMSSMCEAIEQYFEPASKLRTRASVIRTLWILPACGFAPRRRDERVFTATGTWISRMPAVT
jgi:hypothetical protein